MLIVVDGRVGIRSVELNVFELSLVFSINFLHEVLSLVVVHFRVASDSVRD